MSAVNSVGSNQSLYQFLRGITAQQQTQASGVQDTDGDGDHGTEQAGGAQGGRRAHGHHGGHGGGLFKQIEAAVTSALQSAQSDPTSDASSDPNKVIQDAIIKVLQGGSSPSNGAADTGSTTQGPDNAQTTRQDFQQLLQSVGVDPQQFREDFLAAIQQVRGGGAHPSAGIGQTVPPGSAVDMVA